MQTNELMVGDWLLYNKEPFQVTSLYAKNSANEIGFGSKQDFWVDISNVEPIPLTPEILEKNGFPILDRKYKDKLYLITSNLVWHEGYMECCQWSVALYERLPVLRCKYVHELQHILKLIGMEDKKIIL